jgi:hypothetical protein
MNTWDPDKRYREPDSWWDALTEPGKWAIAILALMAFIILMIAVGTIETWGT